MIDWLVVLFFGVEDNAIGLENSTNSGKKPQK